jgi:DNA-binding transcriptional ArsR family regulator
VYGPHVGWTDLDEPVLATAAALAAELADPIRLTALQLLAAEGPHTMSRLAAALEVSAPRLGNHLTRLRAAGLVEVEHTGRHAIYRIADPGLGDVLAALSRYAGAALPTARPGREVTADDVAHTCYDHAAGRLGVALLGHLVERGALTAPDGRDEELRLGPDPAALVALGVEVVGLDPGRRKLATACLDRTHRLPHLGGALGAGVLDAWVDRRLLARTEGARTLALTALGRRELPRLVPGFVPGPGS